MAKGIRTNTKKYAEEVEQLDAQDWELVLSHVAPQRERCAGKRLILPGYVCIHCGSDDPQEDCRETAEQAIEAKRNREVEWNSFTL